ncbi:MAG: biotin synthase BioB [Holophagales bacterium]|jgi:biotin synthase|nr:biotin synthase BioB [Holophagales bacterium]
MPELQEIRAIHDMPFPDLIYRAATVHREHWNQNQIQLCTLDSIKTGACPEDCAYCPQAARYNTGVKPEPLKERARVIEGARQAKANGSTRYCMGASWKEVRDGEAFDQALDIVRDVAALGLEVCVTLGMLNEEQALRLKAAGCTVYNHNIDTSRAFYETIISTHTFEQRLRTIRALRAAGLEVCCGGIVGMGEKVEDRVHFLHELTLIDPPPESIPINQLVPIPGTPLEGIEPPPPLEFIRMIAAARILFPKSRVRLSAGRVGMSIETQALAFLAGANSIFAGEKLLVTPNPGGFQDHKMLEAMGMRLELA